MGLAAGTRLGAYEIVGLIGAGGMGEVYRARDGRLQRDVAIKILPAAFASDPDRLARFEREAQVLASLNHPNIATIHGFESADGVHALVLELVEGPTLADRIAQGPIPLDEALPIAKQIADALEAAHEHGVIHRDLKPANIKLRPDATVKVLDFGLAKLHDSNLSNFSNPSNLSMSPTITSPALMTGAAMILGTAAYMSPEQARGKVVDRRADIWAFGCVLYEMLTGTRAFEDEDISLTLSKVLRGDADFETLPADVPAHVAQTIRLCLQKDSRQRAGDIHDVRLALEGAFDSPARPVPTPVVSERFRRRAWIAASFGLIAALAAGAAATWAVVTFTARAPHLARFAIVPPPAQPLSLNPNDRNIAIAPDGSYIVYRATSAQGGNSQLFVRSIDQLDARLLAGIVNPRQPFISPDGRWVAFLASDGTLKKVSVTGGPPVTVCRIPGALRGAAWLTGETIVFATDDRNSGLWLVPAAGGEPAVLTTPDRARGEDDHWFPSVLPGGRAVIYTIPTPGQLDNGQIAVLDVQSRQQTTIIRGSTFAEYVASGHIVYASGGALRAIRFDNNRLETVGDPVPVLEQVSLGANTAAANFAVSRDGTLVFVPDDGRTTQARRSIVWVSRGGREESINVPIGSYVYARLSPDGTRLALDRRDQDQDIWTWDLQRQTMTRLTFDPGFDRSPLWTPDGKRIVYTSQAEGADSLFWKPADGTGVPVRLTMPGGGIPFATGIASDGSRLFFRETTPSTDVDVWVLALDGTSKPEAIIQTPFAEMNAELSPDSRWLAYQSNESGQEEIYVRSYPDVAGGGRWQISTAGGTRPAWARTGGELFYLDAAGALTAVRVQADGDRFVAGNPVKLFDTIYAVPQTGRTYDVSADAQRFVMIKDNAAPDASTTPASMVVVLNWFQELQRLVPTR